MLLLGSQGVASYILRSIQWQREIKAVSSVICIPADAFVLETSDARLFEAF